jgi:iron complex outermembrane receptor protein
MNHSRTRLCTLLAASAASALLAGRAVAAAAAPDAGASAAPTSLEELVVTARRREENLQTVPVAETAITGQSMERRAVQTMQDLVFATPSLTTTSIFSTQHLNFSMRGRAAENNTFGNTQPVEVYFNDVPQMAAPLSEFYDIQTVQVLRGPQGTLFGRNSNGGAILFQPTRPSDHLEGFLSLQGGNYNDVEVEGAVSVPVMSTLSVRLSGNIVRRDGYTHVLNLNNFDLDNRHSDAFRVFAAYRPFSWLKDDFVYDHVDVDQHLGSNILIAAEPGKTASTLFSPAFPAFNTFIAQNPDLAAIPGVSGGLQAYLATIQAIGPRNLYLDQPASQLIFQNTVDIYSNTASADLGWATLKDIFGYQRERRASGYIADAVPFPILGGYNPGVLPNGLILKRHQVSNEVQLLGDAFNKRVEWLVGGFYLNLTDEIPGNTLFGAAFTITGAGATWVPTQFDKTSKALFTQETWHVTDKLSLTGGFRRTQDVNNIRQFSIHTPLSLRGQASGPAVCTGTTVPASFSAPQCLSLVQQIKSEGDNWILDADYKLNDDIFAYASMTHGYKPGGINTTSTIPALRNYGTEQIKQYEVGLKMQHQFGSVATRLNMALYQQDLTNAQVPFLVFNPARNTAEGVTLNAPKSTVRGFEAEGEVIFNEYFRLSAFGDHIDAKYDQFGLPIVTVDPTQPGGVRINGTTDVSNNPFPNTPKYHYGVTATVSFPTPESVGPMDLSVTLYHQAPFTFATDSAHEPEATVPGYDLINGSFEWRNVFGHPIDLSAFVKNAADKYYIRGGIALENQLGITQGTPGEPRLWGVKLKYHFGG